MKIGNDYFCQVCDAEIPDGEERNEFTTSLLAAKGHCHSECLAQRNAILNQYDEVVRVLGALLDPGIASAQKSNQANFIEGKRTRPLKRATKKQPQTGEPTFLFTDDEEKAIAAPALAEEPPALTAKKTTRKAKVA